MRVGWLAVITLVAAMPQGWAMKDNEIPIDAPNDSLMASRDECREMMDWANAAFLGETGSLRGPRVALTVRRQDHSVLRFRESCIDTPTRIGGKNFAHGLGTHAFSEIVAQVPVGATAFKALVGVDNNFNTAGRAGSVRFSVEVGGKEVVRTGVCKGGEKAVEVSVDLPAGTKEIVLKVDDGGDGVSSDQADWGDAYFILADGKKLYLDQNQTDTVLRELGVPFSFTYGGKASAELLGAWEKSVQTGEDKEIAYLTIRWRDPKTGLTVTADVKSYKRYPATEWVLYFENAGTKDTPILENVQALDVGLRTGFAARAATLHRLEGDSCGERSFMPFDTALEAGKEIHMAPSGGRPSNTTAFPFWNMEYNGAGVITACGWSGQWAASFERAGNGPGRMKAGMELTHLTLHPGEKIRTPRMLVMAWRGDREVAHNRWRRLMMFHYVPKVDGRPARLPVALQCFDRYSWSRPEWATEAGQLDAVRNAAALGFDAHWFDAAWFPGGFPNGVGNWVAKPKEFPRGLGPVGEACHKAGMKFILWFEPERVAAGTEIATQHPEFVFGGAQGGLFKLSDPAARQWLTDLLSKRIEEYGIDIYRNDFNIDPLGFWREADAPDRQGMTEIRYVEGHYQMWDELRSRHPGLLIDNCASGGRRIDLESISRSLPLWRSDTSCGPEHAEWNQAQSASLSEYVPLHTACAWSPDAYEVRSAATGGLICQFDYLNPEFPRDMAKRSVAEAERDQKFWYGDFWPVTAVTTGAEHWIAWQLHRADLDAGIVVAFRRKASPYPVIEMSLKGLRPETMYRVEFVDESGKAKVKKMAGRELLEPTEVRVGKGQSLVVRYEATK